MSPARRWGWREADSVRIEDTMRYVTFSLAGDPTERLGAVGHDQVIDVSEAVKYTWPGPAPDSLLALIEAGPDAWQRMASLLQPKLASAETGSPRLQDIQYHAPIPRPRKNIFCLGQNYLSHAKEAARARERELKLPDVPIFFTKTPTTVTGPFDAVPWDPSVTQQLDYEAELAVIVGLVTKNVSRAQALERVFGYTIINDLSARDLQKSHVQWFKGKSLDGFCPMGPVVVTADEFGDPQLKRISLRLNGDVRQNATTADMIFPVDVTLEFLCRGMTLEPGDVIATGTPEGVGLGRTPQEYMKDGDVMETEIEGIGTMRNVITKI
jgi:2-keto-4-pentenoate hydratase/2-oxohepta-3-ene-1,7-dioic acid hydratase in catechol pathway